MGIPCLCLFRFSSCTATTNKKSSDRMSRAASFLVDIPSRWEPRAKQQPTGLIAYSADWRRQSRPVLVLYRPPQNGSHPGRHSYALGTAH